MKIETLKYEIIEWVTKTNDNSLLRTLKAIKDSNVESTENWFNNLSVEEIASLKTGTDNHQAGDVLTSKEFWSEYED